MIQTCPDCRAKDLTAVALRENNAEMQSTIKLLKEEISSLEIRLQTTDEDLAKTRAELIKKL